MSQNRPKYVKARRRSKNYGKSAEPFYGRRRSHSDESYRNHRRYRRRAFYSPYVVPKIPDSTSIETFFEKNKRKSLMDDEPQPYERCSEMLHRYDDHKEYYSDQQHLLSQLDVYKKPQQKWAICNLPTRFVPKLYYKPNEEKKIEFSMSATANVNPEVENIEHLKNGHNGLGGPVQPKSHAHPYSYEIDKFVYKDSQLDSDYSIDLFEMNKIFEHREIEYVDEKGHLEKVVEHLSKQREFSISCQQHTYRSFQGFVCLVQVSTYEKDFVIDAIKLREEMHVLNHAFTNPRIIKILYNADNKLLWLQRDFSVYMVNCFDIQVAAKLLYGDLEPEKQSLSFLLNKFYSIELGNEYEAFDWRVRPIPSEMIFYLMSTTYFLVLLYHQLKRDLKSRFKNTNSFGNITKVYDEGRIQCKRRYEKLMLRKEYPPKRCRDLDFNAQQTNIFVDLYNLRDELARGTDDSLRYFITDEELEFVVEHIFEIGDFYDSQKSMRIRDFFLKTGEVPVLFKRHMSQVLDILRKHIPKKEKKKSTRGGRRKRPSSSSDEDFVHQHGLFEFGNSHNYNREPEYERNVNHSEQTGESINNNAPFLEHHGEEDDEFYNSEEESGEEKYERLDASQNANPASSSENPNQVTNKIAEENEVDIVYDGSANDSDSNTSTTSNSSKKKRKHDVKKTRKAVLTSTEVFEKVSWNENAGARGSDRRRKSVSFDDAGDRFTGGARRKTYFKEHSNVLENNSAKDGENPTNDQTTPSNNNIINSIIQRQRPLETIPVKLETIELEPPSGPPVEKSEEDAIFDELLGGDDWDSIKLSSGDLIPSSLSEIYELSQISRRKNSQKKKKKKKELIENWKQRNRLRKELLQQSTSTESLSNHLTSVGGGSDDDDGKSYQSVTERDGCKKNEEDFLRDIKWK